MPIPAHVLRFWTAMDEQLGDVRSTSWGAVVTDDRFPDIWDTNYARIDHPPRELSVDEVEAELLPALERVGASTFHVVTFVPDRTTRLLVELSTRGHTIGWDVVMEAGSGAEPRDVRVQELSRDADLWDRVEASIALFGVTAAEPVRQLRCLEAEVLGPAGKRWFGIRDVNETIVSLAALVVIERVGYLDNVATFPEARGRGYAGAIAATLIGEARGAGAEHVFLLADQHAPRVRRLYERVGFRETGRLASTKGPIEGR